MRLKYFPFYRPLKALQLIREFRFLRATDGFDTQWYLQTYPDVAQSDINPTLHYLLYGYKEGRNPNNQFDTQRYLELYPDVAHSGMNPFIHYLRHGYEEGRQPSRSNTIEMAKTNIREFSYKPQILDKVEFFIEPQLSNEKPGYDFILERLRSNEQFSFCKINHGYWERMVRASQRGFSPFDFGSYDKEHFDKSLNISKLDFAANGFFEEQIKQIRTIPDSRTGMYFVPSLTPWPYSAEISGYPVMNTEACKAFIHQLFTEDMLATIEEIGFTGHEIKYAVITGRITEFFEVLRGRNITVIASEDNLEFFKIIETEEITYITADYVAARLNYKDIWDKLSKHLATLTHCDKPPVVLTAIGGSLSTYLGIKAHKSFSHHHFVDLGGAPAAYSYKYAMRGHWAKIYRQKIAASMKSTTPPNLDIAAIYSGKNGLRSEELVNIATSAGVPKPKSTGYHATSDALVSTPIDFIENKPYDFQRIEELLSLSIRQNHHANSGPVSHILEKVLQEVMKLPKERTVVAVANGNAALHIAAGLHAYKTNNPKMRWITSGFNFFSANIGPLAETQVIDCNRKGVIDLEILKTIPLDQYDGLIHCNLFAQSSDWSELRHYCITHGKAFIVDNAVGLLDRPDDNGAHDDLEAISLHHTKPWGMGEGGAIVCSVDDEPIIRQFANFGARLPANANYFVSNYKISEIAAATILNRIELMDYWAMFYHGQDRRIKSILNDQKLPMHIFTGTTKNKSPRSYTPLLCDKPIEIFDELAPFTARKYYIPLKQTTHPEKSLPVTYDLFSRMLCIPNNPEMRLVSSEDIVQYLTSLVR